jgi:hypothetical protein
LNQQFDFSPLKKTYGPYTVSNTTFISYFNLCNQLKNVTHEYKDSYSIAKNKIKTLDTGNNPSYLIKSENEITLNLKDGFNCKVNGYHLI